MSELHDKLVEVQRELRAPKNQRNSFGNYSYRSAEDILEAVKPLLHARGLTITLDDELTCVGDRYYVRSTATVSDGTDTVSVSAFAREAASRKGMDDSQLTGATSSYSRKYSLGGLFAIDDGRDPDTDEHTRQRQQAPEPEQPKYYSDDPSWELNRTEIINLVEQRVPEIDGSAVLDVMVDLKGHKSPASLTPQELGSMIEFVRGDRFLPYYTETIAPRLVGWS